MFIVGVLLGVALGIKFKDHIINAKNNIKNFINGG